MHKGLPLWFGERQMLIVAHAVVVCVYIGFRAALFFKRRHDARQVTIDSL